MANDLTNEAIMRAWGIGSGPSKRRSLVNKVIREQFAGGGQLLDAMEFFHQLLTSLSSERRTGDMCIDRLHDLAQLGHDRLVDIRDAMAAAVLAKAESDLPGSD